jgi:pimeloyl-ACP methyl ester carboxylesterase
MAFAQIDGIKTHYQVTGNGTPLLMLAPGGFDSTMAKFGNGGNATWKPLNPLQSLADEFKVIAYDRREAGESGGRIEPLSWDLYTRHAAALLDHVGVQRAFVLGGCMGVSVATAFGRDYPERCLGLLLHWPVGGYRWMKKGHEKFDGHVAFVRKHGLAAAAERAKQLKVFWAGDPDGGPWTSVIASDPAFAETFVKQDRDRYIALVDQSRRTLFNDTIPSGANSEQLIAMNIPAHIMSGDDASHATSAAHALRELMPRATLSPLMPPQQSPQAVGQWIRESVRAMRESAVAA